MTGLSTAARITIALALLCATSRPVMAEEGLWTFDNFPSERVRAAYGVTIDPPWLEHLRDASVRLTNGCSASIVSRQGLVATNHHCIAECLQALSTSSDDLLQNGVLTDARSEERRCPGIQAEVLIAITDVTPAVRVATSGRLGEDFIRARDAAMTTAERTACGADPNLRCETVSFYRGGEFKVYSYRKYEDVRLVFAPELSAAFFGGDPDNFNFPRFNLDIGMLRLYDDGAPARTPTFLRWNPATPRIGDPMFVSGNPGATERQLTIAQLETARDLTLPITQIQRSELRGRLLQFGSQSAEHRRVATDILFEVENAFKSDYGRQLALGNQARMTASRAAEVRLRADVATRPALARRIGDPWAEIEGVQPAYRDHYLNYRQLESGAGSASQLFDYARMIVRGTREMSLPSAQRLPEFAQSRLPLLERNLFEARPIDNALEVLFLEFWLDKTREYLTADAPGTISLLARESPEALSARLVGTTHLADPAFRRQLWQGGFPAVVASQDPMIQYALRIDPAARQARRAWEDQVMAPTGRAAERIALARFEIEGPQSYPDATFTLRLSYGRVAGWSWRGTTVSPFTTFAGLYQRATGAEPFQISQRWLQARGRLNPNTVFNFTTTNDIVGGNSGSPVVNARGEIIGLAFDGNIHSLGGAYFYDGALNRTVVVSTASISEALDKVYDRQSLLQELQEG